VRGLRIVGSDAEAPLSARDADLRGPLALVVGSEGAGIGPTVRRRCDLLVRIPMRGVIGSLNAAVAGSILLYEASVQRASNGAPRPGETATSGEGSAAGSAEATAAREAATAVSVGAAAGPAGATGTLAQVGEPAAEPTAEPAGSTEVAPHDSAGSTGVAPRDSAGPPEVAPCDSAGSTGVALYHSAGPPEAAEREPSAHVEPDDLLPGGPPVDEPTAPGAPERG
jgi:hypothetical protein